MVLTKKEERMLVSAAIRNFESDDFFSNSYTSLKEAIKDAKTYISLYLKLRKKYSDYLDDLLERVSITYDVDIDKYYINLTNVCSDDYKYKTAWVKELKK